jgi:hypothetical protein
MPPAADPTSRLIARTDGPPLALPGVWARAEVHRRVPGRRGCRAGGGPGWDEAVTILDRLDHHHVLFNPVLDAWRR